MRTNITIGLSGAGGDGVVVMGSFLQKLAALQGYSGQMPRYYGAQIRGGGSAVKLSLDAESAAFPRDWVDILVCFNWETYVDVKDDLLIGPDTLVLHDSQSEPPGELPRNALRVDFTNASRGVTGTTRDKNLVALGFLVKLLGLSDEEISKAIDEDEELVLLKHSLPAIEAGEHLLSQFVVPDLSLAPPAERSPRPILHGNAAVAQAAVKVGGNAFFGYPITPASEIMKEIYRDLLEGEGVFVQAEDEIAAAGMTIGASMAGARAFTATSGPGLDLMTEMMGLATISETPMVIVDVQRGGPSTGIPSGTEQSDLNHAVYGGHGDSVRVVLAPHDVDGCYRLTAASINIAQRYQTVVIMLSDQWLAQTLVATGVDFLESEPDIWTRKKPDPDDAADYRRYKLTDDGISPMSDAGDEGFAYRTSGLSHDERGRPAFDLQTNQTMHDKRRDKLASLVRDKALVTVLGNSQSRKGILTWGSSAQVVLETARSLNLLDEVRIAVPELIHPIPEAIRDFVASTEKLLIIEMNHTGQYYHLLRSQIGLPADTRSFARVGGRPFSIRELSDPISELAG